MNGSVIVMVMKLPGAAGARVSGPIAEGREFGVTEIV